MTVIRRILGAAVIGVGIGVFFHDFIGHMETFPTDRLHGWMFGPVIAIIGVIIMRRRIL